MFSLASLGKTTSSKVENHLPYQGGNILLPALLFVISGVSGRASGPYEVSKAMRIIIITWMRRSIVA